MTYRLLSYGDPGSERAGVLIDGRVYDAAALTVKSRFETMLGILQEWDTSSREIRSAVDLVLTGRSKLLPFDVEAVRLQAPVLYPNAIYCAGANFFDHVAEMDQALGHGKTPTLKELDELPWHFLKSGRSTVVGPGAIIDLPAGSVAVDWELELAAVIGHRAKNVSIANALDCVAGYTIANDLSARDLLKRSKTPLASPFTFDWVGSKNFDGACPMGPWMTPAEEIADPQRLDMKLWVDGVLKQDSSTSQMIFSVAEQIAALSSRVTLLPGDVVLTGTPAGVGLPRKTFLRGGQTVKLWIEGIGEFEHKLR